MELTIKSSQSPKNAYILIYVKLIASNKLLKCLTPNDFTEDLHNKFINEEKNCLLMKEKFKEQEKTNRDKIILYLFDFNYLIEYNESNDFKIE